LSPFAPQHPSFPSTPSSQLRLCQFCRSGPATSSSGSPVTPLSLILYRWSFILFCGGIPFIPRRLMSSFSVRFSESDALEAVLYFALFPSPVPPASMNFSPLTCFCSNPLAEPPPPPTLRLPPTHHPDCFRCPSHSQEHLRAPLSTPSLS